MNYQMLLDEMNIYLKYFHSGKNLRRRKIYFNLIYCSTSSWIRPKPTSNSKSNRRSSTVRAWIRNNIDLLFFWSLYSFICTCICADVLHYYVGQQRAHTFIVIARLNGIKKNKRKHFDIFLIYFY